jgi:hypothetical protein
LAVTLLRNGLISLCVPDLRLALSRLSEIETAPVLQGLGTALILAIVEQVRDRDEQTRVAASAEVRALQCPISGGFGMWSGRLPQVRWTLMAGRGASSLTFPNVRSVLICVRIRAVVVEDEPLTAQYLAEPLDDTCQVEAVGSATESKAGLRLCAELRPDAVFVDINLPGKDGVSLATQLTMLPATPGLYCVLGHLRCAYGPANGAPAWRTITAIRTKKSRSFQK